MAREFQFHFFKKAPLGHHLPVALLQGHESGGGAAVCNLDGQAPRTVEKQPQVRLGGEGSQTEDR